MLYFFFYFFNFIFFLFIFFFFFFFLFYFFFFFEKQNVLNNSWTKQKVNHINVHETLKYEIMTKIVQFAIQNTLRSVIF